MTGPILDRVPRDAPGAREIGFSVPERYNASAILFDNRDRGRGDHPAVVGAFGQVTYGALCREASRAGHALLSLGLVRGERVLLFLDDTPAYPAFLFGAIRAGLVPILVNTLTPPDLLGFYLADAEARVAICEAGLADRFTAAACAGTRLSHLVVVNGPASASGAAVRIVEAASWLAGFPDTLAPADTSRDDMAFWQYSSGSTGRPKGIVHLQHDMLYTAEAYGRRVLEIGPDDICFSVPKIFFAYGLGNSLTFPFRVGATSLLLAGQPKPGPIFAAVARHRPTLFFGLPTLYTALVNAPEAAGADLGSLRLCLSAAEVLSADVAEAWQRLSGLDIVEGLGSTEVLHIYLSNSPDARRTGAAGRRVPGYELKLLDREGQAVADGEEGILWVRGDSNAPSYWNRPDKTAET
ncbi:MAG: AMP-binding protein, partial [Methylobacteriaceae bacterium]|nr:AMP-binding protein [Methylobacteriaceae bacterium]